MFASNTTLIQTLFSFKGRIRRYTFWNVLFFLPIVTFGFALLNEIVLRKTSISDDVKVFVVVGINLLFLILFVWILLAAGVKRCHDIGCSGWWVLTYFALVWYGFVKGIRGPNKYGDDPLQVAKQSL